MLKNDDDDDKDLLSLSGEEELGYDSGDDDDDEDDDGYDGYEDYKQQETEKFLDQASKMSTSNNASTMQNPPHPQSDPNYFSSLNRTFMQQNSYPYGQSTNNGYQPSTPWSTNSQPWSTPRYQPSYTPTFGNQGSIPWTSSTPWNNSMNNNRQQINRNKKIIFCDLLDNLIESLQSCNKLGVQPRGIFDIRLKFEVWDKISCFAPDYIFILTNQNLSPWTEQAEGFQSMVNYIINSLAEYLRLPYSNCKCMVHFGFDVNDPFTKPNTGLIIESLKEVDLNKYKKEDMLVIGSMSGLAGQSNKDSLMAERFGVDYLDIGQLLTMYF